MAFHADPNNRWLDADVCRVVEFDSKRTISEIDADDRANDMHEAVVNEIIQKMLSGQVIDT